MLRPHTAGRQLAAARGLWGLTLLTVPERVLSLLTGGTGTALGADLLRTLGARHVLQAGVTAVAPTPGVLALGGVADGLHAASAVLFVRVDPRQRRAGLLDAAIAAAFGAASVAAAKG